MKAPLRLGRRDLVERVARDAEMHEDDVDQAVVGFFDQLGAALAAGDTVVIRGFGVFTPHQRQASVRRHPGSGKMVRFASRRRIGFRAARPLKKLANGGER